MSVFTFKTRADVVGFAHQLRALAAHYREHGPEPVQFGPDEGQQWVGITPTEFHAALAQTERLAADIEDVGTPTYAESRAEEAWRLMTTLAFVPPGR